jgi:hypothetical protein|nr:hypothetical protein [Neorhizobium tomejilense]
MEKITTIGLDLAKSIFQVHAIAEDGSVRCAGKENRTNNLGTPRQGRYLRNAGDVMRA